MAESQKPEESKEPIDEIDGRACRRTVEERFTSDRMVEKYINVYKHILANHQNET
jgi:glycosyltransferase involved in cell wall biosynthesis